MSEMMVGRKVNLTVEKKQSSPGDVVLEIKDLSVEAKREGQKKKLVHDVSFHVSRGEIVCIAGIDGNGQTELIHAITGISDMSSGTISINGEDMSKKSIRYKNTHGLSHIPEDRHKHGLVLEYNLAYNVILQEYFQPNFQSGTFLKNDKIYEYAEKLIKDYDIRSSEGPFTITRSMSGGNQQKAIVARENL